MKATNVDARLRAFIVGQSVNLLTPIAAIVGALLVSSLLIIAWGADVVEAYTALFSGAFGSPNAWATTLRNWAPLVFTGLAVVYAFRAGFFNIGMEGQLYMGALAGTWVAVTFSDWPGWLLIPAAMVAAGVAGGALCMIPGVLKAWRGVNEVLSTLLLNYIILQFFEWSIRTDKYTPGLATGFINLFGVKDPTQPYPQAADVPGSARLPTLLDTLQTGVLSSLLSGQSWYERLIGTAAYGRITIAVLLSVAAAVVVYILLFKTTIGYQARAVGVNPEAARRVGIHIGRTLILTSFISGALAGMAGGVDILGATYRLIPGFLVGAGFSGIPVALIAQNHPLGVLLSALFFAALRAGGNRMQMTTGVPTAVVGVIQALVVLFVVAAVALDMSTRIQKAQMARKLQTGAAASVLAKNSQQGTP